MPPNPKFIACKILFTLALCFGVFFAPCQSIKAQVEKPASVETGLVQNTVRDSLQRLQADRLTIKDSITAEVPPLTRVFSEKKIRESFDSLLQMGLIEPPGVPKKVEVPEPEFIEALHRKFYPPISQPVIPTGKFDMNGLKNEGPALPQALDEVDLTSLQLPALSKETLQPIAVGQLQQVDALDKLDSVRRLNLKDQRLKLSEQEIPGDKKLVSFVGVPTFRERSYFEGVVGVLNGTRDRLAVRFSPALGYRIDRHLSVGAGPGLHLEQHENDNWSMVWGFRTFGKYEVLDNRAYLHVENQFNGRNNSDEALVNDNGYNLLAGGGGLLPLSPSVALNVMALYTLAGTTGDGISPFIIRIGVSSLPKPKERKK